MILENEIKEYTGKKGFEKISEEFFGIQRKIVANMTSESWKNIPHAGMLYEADITEFIEIAQKIKLEKGISYNSIYLKVLVEALKACPVMNAHIKFNHKFVKGKIECYKDINISMPMVQPNGEMMTVNLHNFENRSLSDIHTYIADIRRRAGNTNLNQAMFDVSMADTFTALKHARLFKVAGRLIGAKTGSSKVKTLSGKAKKDYYNIPESDRLTKKDIEQGTITISNLGSVYRGSYLAPTIIEIVPPQVSAIGIGASYEKPGVYRDKNDKKVTGIRTYLPLHVVIDHRALDFGDIVPFFKKLDEIFKNPQVLYNW